MNGCGKENFIGINITNPGQNPGIHEKIFDRYLSGTALILEIRDIEVAAERFDYDG